MSTSPIQFTQGATDEILYLKTKENEAKHLRIGVKGGGCSGLSYILEFDIKGEEDVILDFEGFQVVMNKDHIQYVQEMEIDFENGLNNRGFVFNNPKASTTCGCGTSFAVAE